MTGGVAWGTEGEGNFSASIIILHITNWHYSTCIYIQVHVHVYAAITLRHRLLILFQSKQYILYNIIYNVHVHVVQAHFAAC